MCGTRVGGAVSFDEEGGGGEGKGKREGGGGGGEGGSSCVHSTLEADDAGLFKYYKVAEGIQGGGNGPMVTQMTRHKNSQMYDARGCLTECSRPCTKLSCRRRFSSFSCRQRC